MSDRLSEIRERHDEETREEYFVCQDINLACNHLPWMLGNKHLNPLVNKDRAELLSMIESLQGERKTMQLDVINAESRMHQAETLNIRQFEQIESLQAKLDQACTPPPGTINIPIEEMDKLIMALAETKLNADTIESLQAERKELLDLLERGWDCRNRDCVNGKIPLREVAGEQDFITCNDCAKRDELLKENSDE